MCQANWYMTEGVSPLGRRSNRTTSLREPCADTREGQAKRRQRSVRAELWSVVNLSCGAPRLFMRSKATPVGTVW